MGILPSVEEDTGLSHASPVQGPIGELAEQEHDEWIVAASEEEGGRSRGRLVEWLVLGAFLSLVILGSWNWAGEAPPPPELSEADLETLAMLRSLRDVAVGEELMMTSTSPDRWILDAGFDAPEGDATWMISTEARLEFTPVGESARSIEVAVYPFLADSVPSRLLVVETSVEAVEAEMRGGGQLVSARLDPALDEHVVTLRCDSVDAPVKLGLGTDVRTLCMKLISVRLVP